jgi:hypothetical protein
VKRRSVGILRGRTRLGLNAKRIEVDIIFSMFGNIT